MRPFTLPGTDQLLLLRSQFATIESLLQELERVSAYGDAWELMITLTDLVSLRPPLLGELLIRFQRRRDMREAIIYRKLDDLDNILNIIEEGFDPEFQLQFYPELAEVDPSEVLPFLLKRHSLYLIARLLRRIRSVNALT